MEPRRLLAADLGASEAPSSELQDAAASIAGQVTLATGEHCSEGEGVANVTLHLLGEQGERLETTTTSPSGEYAFTGLAPGVYAVQQVQPVGLTDAGMLVGNGGGQVITANLLGEIEVTAGAQLSGYRFCESRDPAPDDGGPPQLDRQDFLGEIAGRENVFLQLPSVAGSTVVRPTARASRTVSPEPFSRTGSTYNSDHLVTDSASDTGIYGGSSSRKSAKSPAGLLPDGDRLRSVVERASAALTDKLFESVDWQQAVIDQVLWFVPKPQVDNAEETHSASRESEAYAPVEVASLPAREAASEPLLATEDADKGS